MQVADSSIRIQQDEQRTLLTLTGPLDEHLANNLRAIIPKTVPPVILDVRQTPYITANGLQVLLDFYKVHKRALTLVGVNNTTYMLIKLTGLQRYVTIGQQNAQRSTN